jgi:hypothetical protein
MKRLPISLALSALLLAGLACGLGGADTRRNNEIRRAALAYELATRGPAGELLVAFGLMEVRDNLGFEGGNTVWLNPLAEGDYFRTRDTGQSYLFLHDVDSTAGSATILVDRGDANRVTSYQLTLQRQDSEWTVVADEPLD